MTRFRTHDLKVVDTPLDEIERHPENANQGDVEALEESISVNGFYQPVIVQASSGYILAGNHRWEVAKKMGATSIPAIFLDVTDDEARRMMVADNRITRLGMDDPTRLLDLLDSLTETEYGLLGTGYDPAMYQRLMDEQDEALEFEKEPGSYDDHDEDLTVDPYLVDVVRGSDGEAISFQVTRRDGEVLSAGDYNRVREALGLNKLSVGVLAQYGVANWEA